MSEQRSSRKAAYCPPEYATRIKALTDLIRWGPSCFPNSEFQILLWVAERTLTYGKQSDSSSFAQMTDGIRSWRSGEPIRGGCGLGKTAITKAIKSLQAKGVLQVDTDSSTRKGNKPNRYTIAFDALRRLFDAKCAEVQNRPPCSPDGQGACSPNGQPLVRQTDKYRGDIGR